MVGWEDRRRVLVNLRASVRLMMYFSGGFEVFVTWATGVWWVVLYVVWVIVHVCGPWPSVSSVRKVVPSSWLARFAVRCVVMPVRFFRLRRRRVLEGRALGVLWVTRREGRCTGLGRRRRLGVRRVGRRCGGL